MNIRDVITAVAGYQAAIAITSPFALTVAKVWPYYPPQSVSISDTPAFTNEWIFDREDRITNGLRSQYYTDHMQFWVYDADSDVAADIATAFMEKIVDAFDAHERLGGNTVAFRTKLRGSGGGNRPTLIPAKWDNTTFVGLDLFLDIELTEGKTYGI